MWALLAVLAGLVWLRFFEQRSSEHRFAVIDTARSCVEFGSEGYDPEWEHLLAEEVAHLGPLNIEVHEDIAALVRAVGDLPFVEEVGEAQAIWPDGLSLDVRFSDPVACVALGPHYFAVSSSGLVLPGLWNAPPARGSAYLPVLAPALSAGELLPGDALSGAHLDALSVVLSMREHLSEIDHKRLGRVVVDAERSPLSSPAEPGTRLLLEGRRLVLFGRAPHVDEPGELPAERKWQSLSKALALLEQGLQGAVDWDLVDLRWDQPEMRNRAPIEVARIE
jgi:hypothetical protein